MKKSHRLYAFVCVVMILMSVMAFPAYAETASGEFAVFRQISSANGSSAPGYTKALQRFLMCISSDNRNAIIASGGIDGNFGSTTTRLTKNFQSSCNLTADGVVGRNTWTAIETSLVAVTRDSEGTTWSNSNGSVIFSHGYGNASRYYSYLANGSLSSTYFHETNW